MAMGHIHVLTCRTWRSLAGFLLNCATEGQLSPRVTWWFTVKVLRKSRKHWQVKIAPESNLQVSVWLEMRSQLLSDVFCSCLKWKRACFLSYPADWDGLDESNRSEHVGSFDIHKVHRGRGARWDLWFRTGVVWGWQIAFLFTDETKKDLLLLCVPRACTWTGSDVVKTCLCPCKRAGTHRNTWDLNPAECKEQVFELARGCVYRTEQDKEDRKERVVLESELPERNVDHKCFRQHIWSSATVTQPCVYHA